MVGKTVCFKFYLRLNCTYLHRSDTLNCLVVSQNQHMLEILYKIWKTYMNRKQYTEHVRNHLYVLTNSRKPLKPRHSNISCQNCSYMHFMKKWLGTIPV